MDFQWFGFFVDCLMRGKIKERAPNQVQESLRAEVRTYVVNNSARLKEFENVRSELCLHRCGIDSHFVKEFHNHAHQQKVCEKGTSVQSSWVYFPS